MQFFGGAPVWMCSVAFPDAATGHPKRVSGWTMADKRIALTVATMFHNGVGEGQWHVETSRFIRAWRRKATWAETMALPDVGIVGSFKRKLMER
jgi:hypothetical protein